MLTHFKDLRGQTVYCQDGICGRVFDVFFDDRNGMIQHVVLDIGSWLRRRRVLCAPSQLKQHPEKVLLLELRLDQTRYLPDPDTNPPVSRQQLLLAKGVLPKKALPEDNGVAAVPTEDEEDLSGSPEVTVFDIMLRNRRREQSKGHLRSVREVSGYEVEIECGRVGTMTDVWLNTSSWRVTHLSLRLEAQKQCIAVPATLIRGISWSSGTIRLNASWGQSEEGACLMPRESKPGVLRSDVNRTGNTHSVVSAF